MRNELLKMTKGEVTTEFGKLFDRYVPPALSDDDRKEAVECLANRLGTTSVTLDGRDRQNAKRLAGEPITGTVFDTTCYLIEKMQTYSVEITDEKIWEHSSTLQAAAEARLKTEFDAKTDTLKAEFDAEVARLKNNYSRREAEITEAAGQERALIETEKEQLARMEQGLATRKANLDARQATLNKEASELADPEHPRRVILKEMAHWGLLGASYRQSLFSAKLKLEAMSGSGSKKAMDRMVKEEAFHTITAPVRWVLAVLMP